MCPLLMRRWTSHLVYFQLLLIFAAAPFAKGEDNAEATVRSLAFSARLLPSVFQDQAHVLAIDDEAVEDWGIPLQRRRNDLCGVNMRTTAFRERCGEQDHYYHWDGQKDKVDRVQFEGTSKPQPKAECDHIVELQWLQNQIMKDDKAKDHCKAMETSAKNREHHPDHDRLRAAVTSAHNAVYVTQDINRLKGLYNNDKVSMAALANKLPNQSRATANYAKQTQGRAVKVMKDVYGVFPTLHSGLTASAKTEAAAEGAKRTFHANIQTHIKQIIEDCETSAENCPPGGPVRRKRTKKHGKAAGLQAGTTLKPDSSSSSKRKGSGTATVPSPSPLASQGSVRAKAASSTTASTEQSGCSSLKRSLCEYKPKKAVTSASTASSSSQAKGQQQSAQPSMHKGRGAGRQSWADQRRAALAAPTSGKSRKSSRKVSNPSTASQRPRLMAPGKTQTARGQSWSEHRQAALSGQGPKHRPQHRSNRSSTSRSLKTGKAATSKSGASRHVSSHAHTAKSKSRIGAKPKGSKSSSKAKQKKTNTTKLPMLAKSLASLHAKKPIRGKSH